MKIAKNQLKAQTAATNIMNMKKTLALITTLGLLLAGCTTTTTPHGYMTIPQEVRKMSITDDTLFRDLLTKPGGVVFADMVLYPHSHQKTLTRIEVITPPSGNHQPWQERWFIEHENGETTAYLVKLIPDAPDGKSGTTFTVQRDSTAAKKDTQ